MKKALLAVSFGTAHAETRRLTIEAIEKDLSSAFPDRAFYRAFTSGFIRKKIKASEGLSVDSVSEALERMLSDGVTDALVQPTHMLRGEEFSDVENTVRSFAPRFENLLSGAPLLSGGGDIKAIASALGEIFSYVSTGEMLGLMGHGSANTEPNPFILLQSELTSLGFSNIAVGTVEHEPGIAPVLDLANKIKPAKIYLAPLLVVSGGHALDDMAGDGESSWKTQLTRLGFETECILRGLGEYARIRDMYVSHARQAVKI